MVLVAVDVLAWFWVEFSVDYELVLITNGLITEMGGQEVSLSSFGSQARKLPCPVSAVTMITNWALAYFWQITGFFDRLRDALTITRWFWPIFGGLRDALMIMRWFWPIFGGLRDASMDYEML